MLASGSPKQRRSRLRLPALAAAVLLVALVLFNYHLPSYDLLVYRLSRPRGAPVEGSPPSPPQSPTAVPWEMDYSEPADEGPLQEGTVISKGTVLGTMRGTGEMSRQYYKFENVHLSADGGTIAFYHGPGFQRPKEKWVSTLFNNGTAASLPTVTVVRNATTHTYRYLKIEYLSAEEAQPRCTQWVEKPVYVVQLQHNTNIWHVWTDGLMAAFQSLREQRLLPLGRVDADGRVTEVTDGLGIGCPWVLDENTGTPMQPPDGQCRPRTGLVPDRCDPERDEWCREGVVAVRRAHPDGPMLLVYSGSKIVRPWGPMFRAISRDIRPWADLTGACFREMYLGRTNTLNYYITLSKTSPMLEYSKALRVNATRAFKAFLATVEAHTRAANVAKQGEQRLADRPYSIPLELRQGIGPGGVKQLVALKPLVKAAREAGAMEDDEIKVLKRRWKESKETLQTLLTQADPNDAGAQVDGASKERSQHLEQPRPVVTYMHRTGLRRSVLNAHILLTYLLSRYNVTLRVTTFEEPLFDVIELLAHTDVLIGMHGAGWTNALFMKPGATALQLLPYGWLINNGNSIRGLTYKNIVRSTGVYEQWGNTRSDLAFIRRFDVYQEVKKGRDIKYSLHPDPSWPLPNATANGRPGNHWIYQNTFVDMETFAPVLDDLMLKAGILPMHR